MLYGGESKIVRTSFLFLVVALLLTFAKGFAGAQLAAKVPRIGILGFAYRSSPILEAFRQGLRELGYIEGQNIILEPRSAHGDTSRFDQIAAELVQLNVDIIVAQSLPTIRAAMRSTKTIPVVIALQSDPVLHGFVASLERPGGNVTGVTGLTPELGGKWLEVVKDTIPNTKRVAVLWNRNAEEKLPTWKSLEIAARSLRVDVEWLEVRSSRDIERNFRSAIWGKADAFIVLPGFPGGDSMDNLRAIATLGRKNHLPGIFWRTDFDLDELGGLMAYGASRGEQSRRAAYVVDKILRGTKPAQLPLELPKNFEFVVNLKIARELGITIPLHMLAWTDRVIK